MIRRRQRSWSGASALFAAVALLLAAAVPADAYTHRPASHATVAYCQRPVITTHCIRAAVADLNAARRNEGLGRIVLPSNFVRLSPPQQVFVLINLERIDRHLPPFAGLSKSLDAIAQDGANAGRAPKRGTSAPHVGEWARVSNSLLADYLWMYDGSSATRRGILTTMCGPLLAGTAMARGHSGSALFLQGADHRAHADAFDWNRERAFFPIGSRERNAPALPWVVRTSAPTFYRNNYWTIGISSPGTYTPAAAVRARWYVDGVPQPGATRYRYTLTRAQRGHTVGLKISVSRPGYLGCGATYNFGRIS